MENIIPRWEWRTFGENFGEGEILIKQNQSKVRQSSEIYVLSALSNDNTKIRDMLMDIKHLEQVNQDKLEQWNPLMKAGFPISPENLHIVSKSWKVNLEQGLSSGLSYDDFLNTLVKNHKDLKAIDVFKERFGYKINDCIVELACLKFNGKPINTVAVEHEDPEKVIHTVRELKLIGYENINYLKALKNFAGMKY